MKEVIEKLEELGIKYELIEHKAVYSIEDMENLDTTIFKGAEICKNLFLRDQKGRRHFLVVISSEKQADLTNIQKQAESTRLSFASPERLMKYLGVEAGHVSPMALLHDKEESVEVMIDKELKEKEMVAVHPNTNQASILITPANLTKYIKATNHSINYITI